MRYLKQENGLHKGECVPLAAYNCLIWLNKSCNYRKLVSAYRCDSNGTSTTRSLQVTRQLLGKRCKLVKTPTYPQIIRHVNNGGSVVFRYTGFISSASVKSRSLRDYTAHMTFIYKVDQKSYYCGEYNKPKSLKFLKQVTRRRRLYNGRMDYPFAFFIARS